MQAQYKLSSTGGIYCIKQNLQLQLCTYNLFQIIQTMLCQINI